MLLTRQTRQRHHLGIKARQLLDNPAKEAQTRRWEEDRFRVAVYHSHYKAMLQRDSERLHLDSLHSYHQHLGNLAL